MAIANHDDANGSRTRLEFGVWRSSFQNAYATWTNAPQELKSAMLLKGPALVRAEHWLISYPEKLSEAEKKFILRSISQVASDQANRPEIRIEANQPSDPGGLTIIVAGLVLAGMWVFGPQFLKMTMESALNGGLSEEAIVNVTPPPGTDGDRSTKVAVKVPTRKDPGTRPAQTVTEAPANPGETPPTKAPEQRPASTTQVIASRKAGPSASLDRVRQLASQSTLANSAGDSRVALLTALEAVHAATAHEAAKERDNLAPAAISSLMQALSIGAQPFANASTGARIIATRACSESRGLVALRDDGAVVVARPGVANRTLPLKRRPDDFRAAALDRDCTQLLIPNDEDIAELWLLADGQRLARLSGHEAAILATTMSNDRRIAVTASQDNSARIWDLRAGRQSATLSGHDWTVVAVTVSPDGRIIATASTDKSARLWDAANGKLLRVLQGHHGALSAVAFGPDGQQLLTSSADGTARLWSVADGALRVELKAERSSILSARFSSDGQHVVTIAQDARVQLFEAGTGRMVLELPPRGSGVAMASVSRDRRYLATVTWEGEVVLWQGADGAEIATLSASGQRFSAAMFSADGRTITALQANGATREWTVPGSLSEAMRLARERAGECLSDEERSSLKLGPARPGACDAELAEGAVGAWPVASPVARATASSPASIR